MVYMIVLLFGFCKVFSGHVLLFNQVTSVWTRFSIPGLNLLIVTHINCLETGKFRYVDTF